MSNPSRFLFYEERPLGVSAVMVNRSTMFEVGGRIGSNKQIWNNPFPVDGVAQEATIEFVFPNSEPVILKEGDYLLRNNETGALQTMDRYEFDKKYERPEKEIF